MPPGMIALFGSGETARHGRQIHEALLRTLASPIRIAIVETPAGFQPNVDVVSRKLQAFFEQRLQNFKPEVRVVAARRRGGPYDCDSAAIAAPLEEASYIFAGPGSPSYAARHLRGTRTLDLICRRHEEGAALALSSAAAIAAGQFALPVYEIFKVGDDPHWLPGLDLFARLGLRLTIVPHWNNAEGGSELDTSHAYVGAERFAALRAMLPAATTILGIDEHTACLLDPVARSGRVMGAGGVTVLSGDRETVLADGAAFPFDLLTMRDPAG
ncbi:MAG TPA: cysteinyl-tRNA synthetase [Thermomicrobiaceae bacterium]|nr:cysteinyl-tRNA synthetase [Thermomicrobiaceae bacterium]